MKAMSSEQLRELKVGDTVYTGKEYRTVESVGRKWIKIGREKIDIERARTSHPTHSQWVTSVWKTKEDYDAYSAYCSAVDNARKVIQDFRNRGTHQEVLQVAEFILNLKQNKGS